MQEKIDKLVSLMDGLKPNQKKYALNLLADIINVINNQENEIKSLYSWKTNSNLTETECELHKYILIMIYYGYSQKLIKCIRQEALLFIAENRDSIHGLDVSEMKEIDLILMNCELDMGHFPSYDEFKDYMKQC